ncbi:hypothetical protein [Herminiimonas sp. CN]|uniref:hypothetical protein n=1 Tax=Herminiimonas sp. CN TaxID=1349818 RepID=UPI0004730F35|nr:hypothetical protein [Herminiimonas sp. CN]
MSEDIAEVEEKTEFTFDELDNAAKNKARDKWREHDPEYEWWEFVYEDAVTIGKLIGIEVGLQHSRPHNGKSYTQPDISFSGFWSQGDGCCYSGDLYITQLKGCVTRLREYTGRGCTDDRLFSLAAEGEALYDLITLRLVTLRLTGYVMDEDEEQDEVLQDSRIMISGDERGCYRTKVEPGSCPEEIEEAMNEYVSSFADWIYNQLEKEHDWLTSDECVDEAIEANDCLFDAHGSII